METRNIIKSGPTSYSVSLPIAWVKKNSLKKGDFLYLEEKENRLIYSPNVKNEETQKTISIEVDGKSDEYIEKMLKSGYLTCHNVFILHGKSIKNRGGIFREMIHELIAVEIMEQTSTKIVAHEMLDRNKNSPDKIINRMDMILRGIFDDLIGTAGKKNIRGYLIEREHDLNRLHMLSQRILSLAIEKPSFAIEMKKSNFDLLLDFKMLNLLEMIGDSLKECAEASSKTTKKDALEIIKERYLEIMSIFYRDDPDESAKVSIKTREIGKSLEKFLDKNIETYRFIMPLMNILQITDEIAILTLNKNT